MRAHCLTSVSKLLQAGGDKQNEARRYLTGLVLLVLVWFASPLNQDLVEGERKHDDAMIEEKLIVN